MTKESKEQKVIKKITFDCPEDLAERIERISELGGVPRSRLVLNLVEVGVDFLEDTRKVGILHLAILMRDAGVKLKELSKKWKDK
jgi:high-affinity K+ transport system ATPase subunit B